MLLKSIKVNVYKANTKPASSKPAASILKLLKSNYRLKYVEEEDLRAMLSAASFRDFSKGSYVFTEGDAIESMYIVFSGRVELYMQNHKFQEKIFSIIRPDQLLGRSEVFNCHQIHKTNTQFVEKSTIASIPRESFQKIIYNRPSLSFAVCIIMGNMIGVLHKELSLSCSEVKVLTYLKNLMSKSAIHEKGEILLPREMTHEKLAKILNITRETTSRVFKNLKEKGIINIRKDAYLVLDKKSIIDIAPYYSCLSQHHI